MSAKIKCPFCDRRYESKERLYSHIENDHPEQVSDEMSPSRLVFNRDNKKTKGTCVICGAETKWDENVRRYVRFCNQECKDEYVRQAKGRMLNTYGKVHLLDDPTKQREMLKNRSISGDYTFRDGGIHGYTGSYEKEFLEFLDKHMEFNSLDVVSPCPFTFYYKYEGRELFYIPDIYIPSINLIIEIKDGGDNPNTHPKIQAVDKDKEKLKDELMAKGKYNYLKITNKDHFKFIEYLIDLKDRSPKDSPLIKINENFKYRAEIVDNITDLVVSAVYIDNLFSEKGIVYVPEGKFITKLKSFKNCTINIFDNFDTSFGLGEDERYDTTFVFGLIRESMDNTRKPLMSRTENSLCDSIVMTINEMSHNMCKHVSDVIDGKVTETILEHDSSGVFCINGSGDHYYRNEYLMTNKFRSIQEVDKIQIEIINMN
ncbi:MAG: DUF7487 domain-containing protein [Fusobacteriaceae bacterium]